MDRRQQRSAYHHLYNLAAWLRLRQWRLANDPMCVMCKQDGKVTKATHVDHIVPHKGDMNLFLDRENTQALCQSHHNGTKQREERTGHSVGCDANGLPFGGW